MERPAPRRYPTSRRHLFIALALGLALTGGAPATSRASFEIVTVEQSRSGLLEVGVIGPPGLNGTRIYKHNTSYDLVETDSYNSAFLQAPSIGPADVRFYMSSSSTISKIGANDLLSSFATFQVPSGGFAPWKSTTCGNNACVFADSGTWGNLRIGVVSNNSTTQWGPAYFANGFWFLDIVESQGRLYTISQGVFDHPSLAGVVWLQQFDLSGNALTGFNLGYRTGSTFAIARSPEARFVYMMEYWMDTNMVGVTKVDVTTGQVVAAQSRSVGGWYMQDLAYYPQKHQLVAVGSSMDESRYVIVPFPEDLISPIPPLRSFND